MQVPSQRDDRHERGDQPAEAEHQLGGVALLTGQERLDEDTDDGHAQDDQHGGEQAVFDAGGGHPKGLSHRDGPSAIFGAGSGWLMVVSVWVTAGLITSRAGLG